jgi:predicted small secreted protein
MQSKRLVILAASAMILLAACNLPGGAGEDSTGLVLTAAAATVDAQFTANAQLTPSSTNTPLPSATPEASNTPSASNTAAPTSGQTTSGNSCDSIQFVSDVTIPDHSKIKPDTTFTKTWRIKNAGSCTWSTGYSLVFVSGNAMGGPATVALASSVVPGSTIDLSVDLTAPHDIASYTGNWGIRNASSLTFGSFWVIIDVSNDGSTGTGSGKTLSAASVGQVHSDGTVINGAHAGDTTADDGVQGFVSFDISNIPTDATIEEVQVDFSQYTTDSNPFATMGCLTANFGTYFPLDAADYSPSSSGVDMEWCSKSELSTVFVSEDVAERLQDLLGSSDSLEYRLFFTGSESDNDGVADLVKFLSLKLIVTYSEP